MKGKESHRVAKFVTFVHKWMFLNEVVIELSGVQIFGLKS